MAISENPGFSLTSLRGGMNDTDPAHELPQDQCVLAENVEFFYSSLGERRLGCEAVSLADGSLTDETETVHISQRFPNDDDVRSPEYWVITATPGTSASVARGTFGNFTAVSPVDALITTVPAIYDINAQSLGDNYFISYLSSQDRMHLWDGISLRRAGLAQPAAAPTAADQGSGSYAAVARFYRIRYTRQVGGATVVRSEPSASVSFTPSGSGVSARVTRPALIGESETHWELEASTDDTLFYRIATTVSGTSTYDDSAVTTTYADNTLSEDIGDYALLPSAKYVVSDDDRLILAGHWTDPDLKSRVSWTPVRKDPGVGNHERLPTDLDNFAEVEGAVTGAVMASFGVGYVFTWHTIHSLHRTGDVTRAYDVIAVTHEHGAIPGSMVASSDYAGNPTVYFLDPAHGPSSVGPGGVKHIRGLRQTWERVNTNAVNIVARVLHYHHKDQIHWWVAADGRDTPFLKLVLQLDQFSDIQGDVGGTSRRGWSLATGRIAQALSVAVLTEPVTIGTSTFLREAPFVGLSQPDFVQRCDTGDTDAGQTYTPLIRTRPYIVAGLLDRWGVMAGTLLATANATKSVTVRAVKDFGRETLSRSTSLAATGSETFVTKDLDSFSISDARTIQFEFTDA